MTEDEADRYYDQWLTAKARNQKLTVELRRLRDAMKPFVAAANTFDGLRAIIAPEDCFAYSGISRADGPIGAITVADLRRARAAFMGED